jgi:broad specificity phosphatase PhoE
MYVCRRRLSLVQPRAFLDLFGTSMLRRTFLTRSAALLALPLIALAAAPVRPVAETSTTIILVRHGEKTAEPREDPLLSPAGEARAMALADAVRGAGLSAIYSTAWKRTQSTARPASEQLKIPITTFDAPAGEPGYGRAYAAELLAKQRGKVVLVVGHSNTVPGILRGLGIVDPPLIADSEYDNVYIVTVPETGPPRLVRARYGAAS